MADGGDGQGSGGREASPPEAGGDAKVRGSSILRRPWLPWAAVAAILALHLALTAEWMTRTGYFARPPAMDGPYFRMEVVPMLEGLERDGLAGWLEAGRIHDKRTPPLMHMVTALAAGLDGRGELPPEVLWRSTAFFWVVFALGVRRLARHFAGPWTSVLAMLLACSAPVVITWMRPYYRQLPMAAVEVWVLDALVRSRGFRRLGPSIAAGALAGLALLVKELVPVYVGGAVLVALVHGLAPAGARLRVGLHAAGALAAAALVASFWYREHWQLVVDYATGVTGEEGQVKWSLGVPFWSFERWLYYPLHFVNGGFGLLLCLLAAALLGRELVGRKQRREIPGAASAPGPGSRWGAAALLAAVALAYPVITFGQIEGAATFTVDFVPAAAVGLAALLARCRPAGFRRAALGAALAACAWQTWASYRGPDDDRPIPESFPLQLAPRTDVIMTAKWRTCALREDPAAEPWPIAAFAERILREAPSSVPRLGLIPMWQDAHADSWNFAYEAWRLGGLIRPVGIHRAHVLQGEALRALFAKIDFLVLAHRENGLDPAVPPRTAADLRAMIEAQQLPLEILETREVTPLAVLSLLKVTRPWAGALVRPLRDLESGGVLPAAAAFANGWRLLGWLPSGIDERSFAVTTFWAPGADPPLPARISFTAEFAGAGRLRAHWSGELAVPWGGLPPGSMLAIPSDRMLFPAGALPPVKGRLALADLPKRASGRGAPVPVLTSSIPRSGPSAVILVP